MNLFCPLLGCSLTCRLTVVLGSWIAVALLGSETGSRIWVPAWPVVVRRVWGWPSTWDTPPEWLMKNCCKLGAAGWDWGWVWSLGLLWAWWSSCGLVLIWGWAWVMSCVWVWSLSGLPEETVTSSNLTTVGREDRAWELRMELGIVAVADEQFDRTALSIFTTFEFRIVGIEFMAGTEVTLGDREAQSAVLALFSTSSCIFSASTSLCSCSSFLINSSICRSFSWSLLSFSSGTWTDGRGEDRRPAPPEFNISDRGSHMPPSCWRADSSLGIGETGGVGFMLSRAICWTGRTIAGAAVVLVTSMGTEERVVMAGEGMVVGAELLGLSWKGFSLSIRSVFVPETGRPRSFSSSLSSATWTRKTHQLMDSCLRKSLKE